MKEPARENHREPSRHRFNLRLYLGATTGVTLVVLGAVLWLSVSAIITHNMLAVAEQNARAIARAMVDRVRARAAQADGTGIEDFRALRERIKNFQRDLSQRIAEIRRERSQRAAAIQDPAERREVRDAPIDPRQLPAFDVEQAGFTERLHRAMLDILVLAIMNVVFLLGSYVRFLRYDVA